jgi:plasmid maintenance system killer protein
MEADPFLLNLSDRYLVETISCIFYYPFSLIISNFAMDLSYKTHKLKKQLTNPKELVKTFGKHARKVNQRIKELSDADNLAVMRSLPAARCHGLTGNHKGKLAVDISGNYRLIFEPNHQPAPQKDDGGLNWEEVTKIQINEISDYH